MSPAATLTPGGPTHWGVMLAQGWKGELRGAAAPAAAATIALDWAAECEALGFDGLWLFDHFVSYPDRAASSVLEAWTTLGALTRHTSRIALGTLVSCTAYRYPQVTAAMAATLAELSGGRFCLGLRRGWDCEEFDLLTIPFPSPATRSQLLSATAAACRLRTPQQPLLIGGEGVQRTLRTAAQFADLTNWQVGPASFRAMSRVLGEWCAKVGRDFDQISRTHAANVKIFASERDFRHWKQTSPGGLSSADLDRYIADRGALYGTAERIASTVAEFIDAGCGGFMLFCNDAPDHQVLQQLAGLRPVVN